MAREGPIQPETQILIYIELRKPVHLGTEIPAACTLNS